MVSWKSLGLYCAGASRSMRLAALDVNKHTRLCPFDPGRYASVERKGTERISAFCFKVHISFILWVLNLRPSSCCGIPSPMRH